jgi:hypothetical protein
MNIANNDEPSRIGIIADGRPRKYIGRSLVE